MPQPMPTQCQHIHVNAQAKEVYKLVTELPNSESLLASAYCNLGVMTKNESLAINPPDAPLAAEAACLFELALKADGAMIAAHAGLVNAYNIAGRFDEALEACDKALGLEANNTALHEERAFALLKLGRASDALADVKAVEEENRRTSSTSGSSALHAAVMDQVGNQMVEEKNFEGVRFHRKPIILKEGRTFGWGLGVGGEM